jgi:hypothetical protein
MYSTEMPNNVVYLLDQVLGLNRPRETYCKLVIKSHENGLLVVARKGDSTRK